MYVCMYVCIYTCVCLYVCVYIHVCVFVCIHMGKHVFYTVIHIWHGKRQEIFQSASPTLWETEAGCLRSGCCLGPPKKHWPIRVSCFFSFIITMIFITTSISISIIIIFFFYCDNKWRKMNSPTSHILPIHTEHWSTSYPWPLSDDGNVAIDYAQTVAIGICFQKSVDGDGSMLSYQWQEPIYGPGKTRHDLLNSIHTQLTMRFFLACASICVLVLSVHISCSAFQWWLAPTINMLGFMMVNFPGVKCEG